jgi:hypothetical protein
VVHERVFLPTKPQQVRSSRITFVKYAVLAWTVRQQRTHTRGYNTISCVNIDRFVAGYQNQYTFLEPCQNVQSVVF